MSESFTAIILSYKRPWNIQRICDTILSIKDVSKLILSNNKEGFDLAAHLDIRDPRFSLINQEKDSECIKRFEIALAEGSGYFFCIDDDLLLSADQIRYLMRKTTADPDSPHGFWGQVNGGTGSNISLRTVLNVETPVDILNRAYFFTRRHVVGMFSLMKAMGISLETLGPCDDIFLSFSGSRLPKIHDIEAFEDCPSSDQIGIALWQEHDFTEKRNEMLKRIHDFRLKANAEGIG